MDDKCVWTAVVARQQQSNKLCAEYEKHGAAHLTRLLCCDVTHKGLAALDGSDWVQINANDQAAHRHVLDSYLKPSSYTIQADQLETQKSTFQLWAVISPHIRSCCSIEANWVCVA